MNDKTLLQLWGKTDKADPTNYHPLLFHLLDVGHVIQKLWWEALSARSRERLALALGLDLAATERLVTLLGAQHDLGKASAFQRKDSGLWNKLNRVGLDIPNSEDRPHGYVSTKALPALATAGIGGWRANGEVARALAKITGGHHGTFPISSDLKDIRSLTLGKGLWDEARAGLLRELAARFYADEELGENPISCLMEELADPTLLPLLGGLISVADWVGSSHHFRPEFRPESRPTIAQYLPLSRGRAEKALEDFGWTTAPDFAPPAPFGEIFRDKDGKPFNPNAMQKQAVLWADAVTEPYLLIIEAAMGDGKTEAALYAADRALTSAFARGFYVALPTQATGNAMFRRVRDYLNRHGGVLNLQLVHAGALLSEEFDALRKASEALHGAAIYDDTSDPDASAEEAGQAGRVVAEDWFVARKRPLLARFGVGTIDQTLMGVLQTRHWFVRLLGLAGKVIIFDEVHAYDVYMSALLCLLLRWLRALDCTVILLSATLPTSARDALLGAWRGDDLLPEPAPYPRLTLSHGDAPPEAISVANPDAPTKDVKLQWIGLDWASVLRQMNTDLPDGGLALLLCNTVNRAQEAFRTLGPVLEEDGWIVRLFHARTPAGWRQEREKWALDTFGKDSPLDRQGKKILLVATQVVEQSLDLDFDWMASEMAPGDLLLQRMGRLWRHKNRLRATDQPRFSILCEEDANGFPVFPDYAEVIYERYVLLRSWLALRARDDELSLPGAIDPLVQEVYAPQLPEKLSGGWLNLLNTSRQEMFETRTRDEQTAASQMIPAPGKLTYVLRKFNAQLFDDDDPKTHQAMRAATRLGRTSVSVVCFGETEDGTSLADMSKGEPTLREVRELLKFSLSTSQVRLVRYLLDERLVPTSWRGNAHLRFHRTLTFVNGVSHEVPNLTLTLSKAEGLTIQEAK